MTTRFDVAILGSGIGGTMLACILARHGLSVLVVEDQVHPRFTIGESLIPETGVRLRIIGEKYGVPEIGWLGSFHLLRDRVSSACGVKRSFSFVYHRPGQAARPEHVNQLPTLTPPFGPDSHLFRQDTDAWLAAVAVGYGATLRQQTRVTQLDLPSSPEGEVKLRLASGEEVRARYLIDAGGVRSPVSAQLGLRDAAPRFRTDSRALYTHMVGVPPADLLVPDHGMPSPLGQATMHHVFDGGWMWVIPFHNHRDATSPLTSVGLMLDRRRHPEAGLDPEAEFRTITSRYPSMRRHFERAQAIRPWVASGRLQYSQTRHLGPRVLQLPHAACFIDPLYSSGMSVLTVAVDLIAETLLQAMADGDLSTERFQPIEDMVNRGFDHYDLIISRSYDTFADYDLWNAWNRNWVMGNFVGTWGPLSLLLRYLQSGDVSHLRRTTEPERIGVLSSHVPQVRELMQESAARIDRVTAGELTRAEAASRIFARLGAADFLPPYMGFGRPEQHHPATFTLQAGVRHVRWYAGHPDPFWRDHCGFSLLTYGREVASFVMSQTGTELRRAWAVLRDVFFAGNQEWRYTGRLLPSDRARLAPRGLPEVAAVETMEQP